jgi:hypothetical protein
VAKKPIYQRHGDPEPEEPKGQYVKKENPKNRGGRPPVEEFAQKPSDRFPLKMSMGKHHMQYKDMSRFKAARTVFEKARTREKMNAAEKCYSIDGKPCSRYVIMETIIQLTYDGMRLPEILALGGEDDSNVLPTAFEVTAWFELHPDFKEAFSKAEKYMAEVFNTDAVNAVLELQEREDKPTRDDIAVAKLVKETLIEQAAFYNDKFQSKTKQQIENIGDKLSMDQAMEQLKALISANPEIAELVNTSIPELPFVTENHDVMEP